MQGTAETRIWSLWERMFERRSGPRSATVVSLISAGLAALVGSYAIGWPLVAVAFTIGFGVVAALWVTYLLSKKLPGWDNRNLGAVLIFGLAAATPASATCIDVETFAPIGVVAERTPAVDSVVMPQCSKWLGIASVGSTILCGVSWRAAVVTPSPISIGLALGSCLVAVGATGALAESCSRGQRAAMPEEALRILRDRYLKKMYPDGSILRDPPA